MKGLQIAIDPGTEESAFIIWDRGILSILEKGILPNREMIIKLDQWIRGNFLSPGNVEIWVEMVASYGMPIGRDTMITILWIGRILEWFDSLGEKYDFPPGNLITRQEVKKKLGLPMNAKDGNVRRRIMDCFPPIGGGKTPEVGTKNSPGILYGISRDLWSAMAIIVQIEDPDILQKKLWVKFDLDPVPF